MSKCSRNGCDKPACLRAGDTNRCDLHQLFKTMRSFAQTKGKTIPTVEELERLVPADMLCPICGRKMVLSRNEDTCLVMTLQHWRDGSFGLVCFSCNSRDRDMPTDGAITTIPPDSKWCRRCETVKPLAAFSTSGKKRYMPYCKPCDSARVILARKETKCVQ